MTLAGGLARFQTSALGISGCQEIKVSQEVVGRTSKVVGWAGRIYVVVRA